MARSTNAPPPRRDARQTPNFVAAGVRGLKLFKTFHTGNRLPCRSVLNLPRLPGTKCRLSKPKKLVLKSFATEPGMPADFIQAENCPVRLIPGTAIDSALTDQWRALQQSNPDLESPCFAPEFTKAVAMARNDVEAGVVEENGKVVAIFPFQRKT